MPKGYFSAVLCIASAVAVGGVVCRGQDSGFHLNVNASSHVTAAEVGLPVYPGAALYKEKDKDKDEDSGADLGFSVGDFHFVLKVAGYISGDSPDKILAFYRKPLSRFGEVLECNHGKPVGALTVTRSGLTCSDQKGGSVQLNGTSSGNDHELRAGSPHQFRIVGVGESKAGSTRFGLVYLELPMDKETK